MNGTQIEKFLQLVDSNIDASMERIRPEIVQYMDEHLTDLAQQILTRGYAIIPTRSGDIRISREDLKELQVA